MNLPNKLSIIRICFIPFVIFFYMQDFAWGKIVAAALFVLAAFTDMLDGYIARKYNLVTDLGKLLDTNADKILVMAGLLLVVCDGTIPAPYGVLVAVIILGRDMIISAFRQIAASKNYVMAADRLGKIKALLTDVAIVFYMIVAYLALTANNTLVFDIFAITSHVLIGISVLLTIVSCINYIVKNKGVVSQK